LRSALVDWNSLTRHEPARPPDESAPHPVSISFRLAQGWTYHHLTVTLENKKAVADNCARRFAINQAFFDISDPAWRQAFHLCQPAHGE
jgi:hypothetical protein